MQNVYTKNFNILSSQTDVDFKLRFDAIANVFQDVTIEHSKIMRVDRDTLLQKSNAFWVLSKMKFSLNGEFELFEPVSVTTWPCTPSLIRFNRCYTIISGSKNINAVSEWCILDATTKTLRKSNSVCYPTFEHQPCLNGLEFSRINDDVNDIDFSYYYKTLATDVDSNNHVNNVAYVRMVLNAFTPKDFKDKNFKNFEIHFLNQSYLGDEISVFKKQLSPSKTLIIGKILQTKVFTCVLEK